MNYTESPAADLRADKPLESSDSGDLSLVEAVTERTGLQNQLYVRYRRPLLQVFLHRRIARDAAEDLLQRTFLQAIKSGERLEQAESPRAWLFGIARHVGLSALRKKRPLESIPDGVAAGVEAESDPRREVVRSAIERLSPPLRSTLDLRLRHDLSYEEIAALLRIPVGTVRSRLHHAVRRLRDEVGDNAPRSHAPTEGDS